MSQTDRPTSRQLSYLKALANQTGTSFAYPNTRGEASREIDRIKTLKQTGGRRLPDAAIETDRDPTYSARPREDEIAGHGSQAHWRGRGSEPELPRTPKRPITGQRTELARYRVAAGERVLHRQQVAGSVRITDRPADGQGRSYLVERDLQQDGERAVQAIAVDYLDQARRLDRVPMAGGQSCRPVGECCLSERPASLPDARTLPRALPVGTTARTGRAGHPEGSPMSPTAAPPRPRRTARRRPTPPATRRAHPRPLGHYQDPASRLRREIITIPGPDGSTLLVDRLAGTRSDARLIARLAVDEPVGNARRVAEMYLADPTRGRCRRLRREDLQPPSATPAAPAAPGGVDERPPAESLHDAEGRRYAIREMPAGRPARKLRWTRTDDAGTAELLSVRDVVGALEAYEPARMITEQAIRQAEHDPDLSACRLREELRRLNNSSVVLNRGLREAVLARVAAGEVSLSEIAIRCGRAKQLARGKLAGETSWLSRRIGVSPDSTTGRPSPWVHADVLATIAREGLGICPREVELD